MSQNIVQKLYLALSAVGFFDALYLTAQHYRAEPGVCLLTGGCETVTTSIYATVGSIPVALIGVIFYFLVFLLALASVVYRKQKLLLSAIGLATLGFLFSLWLVYLQAFVLKAFCSWCLVSAIDSLLLFSVGAFYLLKNRSTPIDTLGSA